ncbi:D-3-phosphoglycerate dehydrogenase [Gemmobacter aquatilis]|uniref:D-3-phosphoglycerate dehydrogenase n=1 Tax=Gemmobacter aquatilis TaxID=933059 RepID=A0A1H7Y6P3_9RHOB|nr:NAD(P)-dependent oxidoreductase [Gemmobacter aquatilis]SEM41007.1 D-3-phosphoglycerate dehydrogenase [Gemmobacter aquatilis]
MPHVLVAGKIHPSGLALLRGAAGVSFDMVEEVSEPSYAPLIDKADALVLRTQPLGAETVARAARLQIVSRHGVGFDAVDVAALNARGIALSVVGDVNTVAVAEHAMMMMLAATKRVLRADRAVRDPSGWGWRNRLEAGELGGKTLLLLGFGRIGRQVAKLAAAFDMTIIAHDPWLERQGWPEGAVRPVSDLGQALALADVISVHMPKADRPALGAAELAQVKPGVVIVNTARGGIVDEAALAVAVQEGRVGAAGLDVFDDEPPAPAHPLLRFDQVLLSPHIGGLTAEGAERLAIHSVQNVLDFFAGRLDPALVVNAGALARKEAAK